MRLKTFLSLSLLFGSAFMSQPLLAQEEPVATDARESTEQASAAASPTPPAAHAQFSGPPPRVETAPNSGGAERKHPRGSNGGKKGFLLELSTAGLASSDLVGGIFLGFQGSYGALGVGFDHQRSSLNEDGREAFNQRTDLHVGVRVHLADAAAGRVELLLGMELGMAVASRSLGVDDTDPASADGGSFAVGPTLRVWLFDGLAVGYQSRFRMSSLRGPGAFFATNDDEPLPDEVEAFNMGLNGRFSLFGVF